MLVDIALFYVSENRWSGRIIHTSGLTEFNGRSDMRLGDKFKNECDMISNLGTAWVPAFLSEK